MVYCIGLNYINSQGISVLQDIRELSDIELSDYYKYSKIINKYINLNNAIFLLRSNYEEYLQFLSNPEDSIVFLSLDDKMNKILLKANKLLSNLLFSISATKNHFKFLLDKNEQVLFEDKMKYLYNNNNEYTFIWELRNYAQHFFLPLTNIHINEHIEGEQILKSIEFQISKKELVTNKKDWKRITSYINGLPENINLLEFLPNIYSQIMEVYKNFSDYHIEKYNEAFKYMANFINEIQNFAIKNKISAFYPCIMYLDINQPIQMLHLYLNILHELKYFEKEVFIIQ